MMTYTHAMDLGDTAYSYNNDKDGVYFFWDVDKNAYNNEKLTASTFSTGHMALAGAGGLIIGVLVAVLIFISKKKKQVQE